MYFYKNKESMKIPLHLFFKNKHMYQQILLVVFLVLIYLYFRSILSKSSTEINEIKNPLGIKIILVINCLGIISFILPWINLPFIGGVNAIELLSDSFATQVNETTSFSIVTLSILFLLNIIGSIIQLKSNISKKTFTKNFEILSGVLSSIVGYMTISEFKVFWRAPSDSFMGDALAMTISIGWGLYFIILLGLAQIISTFIIRTK
jgi:hypothetical protein